MGLYFCPKQTKIMKITAIITALFFSLASFAGIDGSDSEKATTSETNAATCIVKGTVVDELTGDPLAGVTVTMENGMETYTDFEGNFVFCNLKPGAYRIETSLISYENITFNNVRIDSDGTQRLSISLKTLKD